MKKLCSVVAVLLVSCALLQGCGAKSGTAESVQPTPAAESVQPTAAVESVQPTEAVETAQPSEAPAETEAPAAPAEGGITEEMAFEGVNNYCHQEFDWEPAKENPELMYVAVGEGSETEYKIIFRSYTSSFVYFYVDKETGTTRMVEYVPGLEIENDLGTIELSDYLEK